MRFYKNDVTWPFYLFIYMPPSTSFCPCQTAPAKVAGMMKLGMEWTELPQKNKKKQHTKPHTLAKTSFQVNISSTFSPLSLFSIHHLALSSINLQNALFKLLINTLIDLQKCHSEARAVDGHEPTAVQPTAVQTFITKWWMSEPMCTLQSASLAFGYRGVKNELARCWSRGLMQMLITRFT